ncbi:ribonuclease P protein component [Glaciibacter flavus]|uniref:Ribonuclease P protein component n=1 Tax=Orlajensenia flava TaxID=2565934 RepID=A0A4V3WU00_9MICO|nr:ribonuclease P protein component [Glaciibacter flavus]THG34017.1 ribonuclease P protein component [Glaciibacter flavus]
MLAKANRVTTGDDYRSAVRRGRRFVGANTVTYVRSRTEGDDVRFGFIVAKNVGAAVHRNRVRRRLKAASAGLLTAAPLRADIVIRALPGSSEASWDTLRSEVEDSVSRAKS